MTDTSGDCFICGGEDVSPCPLCDEPSVVPKNYCTRCERVHEGACPFPPDCEELERRRDELDRAADELADGELAQRQRAETAEHQLATLARHVLDDDQVAARDYLAELGFGLTDGEEVLRGTAR